MAHDFRKRDMAHWWIDGSLHSCSRHVHQYFAVGLGVGDLRDGLGAAVSHPPTGTAAQLCTSQSLPASPFKSTYVAKPTERGMSRQRGLPNHEDAVFRSWAWKVERPRNAFLGAFGGEEEEEDDDDDDDDGHYLHYLLVHI
ncbi:hypothetical protein MKZ38_008178 [Zalerion maritima]|uniref:Uncharacterized protein n=1 Tax=Zalerion maritima TaxID=339359 RepID=A0AAD5WW89_9PEZI|nr:hypothetical protein MKZ38_008178 [Zalerion maritima]